MKRLFALLLAMTLLLCGCGEPKSPEGHIGSIPDPTTAGTPVPQDPEPDPIPDNTMVDALVNNDRICVKIGEQWGFIDIEGNVIIEPMLNNPSKFNAGLLPVNNNGLWGYMNPDGEWAIEPTYLIAMPFSEGYATVGLLDESLTHPVYSIINHTGRTITQFRDGCGRGWPMNKGVSVVGWSNQKYAVVDRTGSMVFDTQFESFYGDESTYQIIFEGLIGVQSDGKWGFIDSAGDWIIEAKYEGVERFRNSLCTVKIDGKWGVIDTTGKVVIEPAYDWYVVFHDGLAKVNIDGKAGYINTKGEVVIEPQYESAMDFYKGVALAKTSKGWGLIDKTGKWLVEPTYREISRFSQGLAAVSVDGTKWGYIDTTGKLVIAADYRCTTPFYEDGYAAVMTQEGKWTVIDDSGYRIFDKVFDGVGNYDGTIDENGRLSQSTIGR